MSLSLFTAAFSLLDTIILLFTAYGDDEKLLRAVSKAYGLIPMPHVFEGLIFHLLFLGCGTAMLVYYFS